jgi:hypothetical protein
MATNTAKSQTPVPPPPRATGDAAADSRAIIDWLWQFFEATVIASGLLDPSNQATAQTIDASNLPDPADTTIATAQATANAAVNALLAHSLYP